MTAHAAKQTAALVLLVLLLPVLFGFALFGTGAPTGPCVAGYARVGPGRCVRATWDDGTNTIGLNATPACVTINLFSTYGIPSSAKVVWLAGQLAFVTNGVVTGQYAASIDFFKDSGCTVSASTVLTPSQQQDHFATVQGYASAVPAGIVLGTVLWYLPIYIAGQTTFYGNTGSVALPANLVISAAVGTVYMYED